MRHSHKKTILSVIAFLICIFTINVFSPSRAECASIGDVVFGYFRDRGNDLLDIFRFRISAARQSLSFGVHARATSLLQVGCVYFEGEHFGLDRRAIGVWREERFSGGLSALYFTDIVNDIVYGNRFTDVHDVWSERQIRGIVRNNVFWDDGRLHPLSIGAEAQLGLIPGLDVGLYPTELIDFVVGIFTLDPWDDDLLRIESLRPSPQIVETEPLLIMDQQSVEQEESQGETDTTVNMETEERWGIEIQKPEAPHETSPSLAIPEVKDLPE